MDHVGRVTKLQGAINLRLMVDEWFERYYNPTKVGMQRFRTSVLSSCLPSEAA